MTTKNSVTAPELDIKESTLALTGTSAKIRYLNSLGKSRGQIEKLLFEYGVRTAGGSPIRYQHIRNVLITPLTSK